MSATDAPPPTTPDGDEGARELLLRVRQMDYVQLLGLHTSLEPQAIRLSAQALRATAELGRDEAQLSQEEMGEVLAALADAEAVLLDPARGPLYALQQRQQAT